MEQQYEEERLQRLVQEEAVKFLWTQVSVVHQCLTFFIFGLFVVVFLIC